MTENYSYLTILDRMLARVDNKYDKRESSIIYNALAPVALEFSNAYLDLSQIENEGFADTANYTNLKRRAEERGLTPEIATNAVLKGKFDKEIPYGTRFTGINTTLNYAVYDLIESTTESDTTYYYYQCVCEDTGEAGNEYLGGIIPIDGDIEGLGVSELTEVITHGENDENTEVFRERYFDSIKNQSFGGNVADYIETVKTLPDVGGVKVEPVWNGGGTVKVVITNYTFGVPTTAVVSAVKQALDPTEYEGQGVGLAPIGHVVTVQGVTAKDLTVTTTITYQSGYTFDDISVAYYAALDGYYAELNEDWENNEKTVVRISQIESRLLDIEGVLDVSDTKINGNAENYQAGIYEIVQRAVT